MYVLLPPPLKKLSLVQTILSLITWRSNTTIFRKKKTSLENIPVVVENVTQDKQKGTFAPDYNHKNSTQQQTDAIKGFNVLKLRLTEQQITFTQVLDINLPTH